MFAAVLVCAMLAGGTVSIKTDIGTVFGTAQDGVQAFLGIQYGKPPVGERR